MRHAAESRIAEGYFTLAEAVAFIGINERTLRDWIERGLVYSIGRGRGRTRYVTFRGIYDLALLARLRDQVTLRKARRAQEMIELVSWETPTGYLWIEVNGPVPTVFYREEARRKFRGRKTVGHATTTFEPIFVDLEAIKVGVKAKFAEWRAAA